MKCQLMRSPSIGVLEWGLGSAHVNFRLCPLGFVELASYSRCGTKKDDGLFQVHFNHSGPRHRRQEQEGAAGDPEEVGQAVQYLWGSSEMPHTFSPCHCVIWAAFLGALVPTIHARTNNFIFHLDCMIQANQFKKQKHGFCILANYTMDWVLDDTKILLDVIMALWWYEKCPYILEKGVQVQRGSGMMSGMCYIVTLAKKKKKSHTKKCV